MGATTIRSSLERLICNHPYDADRKTCRCVLDPEPGGYIQPLTELEHAAHVVKQIFHTLNGVAVS